MRRLFWLVVSILLAMLIALPLPAIADNVALNKSVTLSDLFYNLPPWTGTPADKSTIVDGVYLTEGNDWALNTVYWSPYNTGYGVPTGPQYIVIDLLGSYTITGFSVQADDNDRYLLSYWDSSNWVPIWTVPSDMGPGSVDLGGSGMQTRSVTLGSPIVTTILRFEGVFSDGQVFSDNWFAVSEIQAYGPSTAVPEPATMLLLGSGLIGLAGYGRKKFFKK
jgi:hypothetical protein